MENNYPWQTSRPFNAYSNHMRKRYPQRVQKLSVDAGFTCPNRDGTLSKGGCTFCSNDAFNPSYCRRHESIAVQIEEGIKFHSWRYKHVSQYLVYFQPYSNTYADLDTLKKVYRQALSHPSVIGLVIGTRPDCVDEKKLDYLAQLNEEYHIIVEYGIESCYDKTLALINRGHTFECTANAIEQTRKRNIETGGHIIFGLPGETKQEMLDQAKILSRLPVNSLKFHQLQILDNTPMMQDYLMNKDKYHLFGFEEYTDFIISCLELLNPQIVIERFASEVPPHYNVGKSWGKIRNEQIVQTIESEMLRRNTYQGRLYRP